MKAGVSSLNPYAASYIPLAKREAPTAKGIFNKPGNEAAWFQPSSHHPVPLKCDSDRGSSMQNPGEMSEKQIMDEESYMDLEHLRMTFPGLSNESILDVYKANNEDLEATVDMLNQLEMHSVEFSETLPDTLDIGDVSESVSSTTCAVLKLKNVTGETGASSSDSTESTVVA